MIAYVLVALLVVVTSIIVVNQINKSRDDSADYLKIEETKNTLQELDSIITDLSFEAPGSKRKVSLDLPEGRYYISGDKDTLEVKTETQTQVIESGVKFKQGSVTIQSGPSMDATETDYDTDGENEYIIENDYVAFAVKKIGSSDQSEPLNMSNVIEYIENKELQVSITPETKLMIDHSEQSYYGTGYTKIVDNGPTKGILIHIDSSYAEYDAIFTLGSFDDYLTVEVKNIQRK